MVELLAPAGSFQSFIGALNAGADAIYLGAEKYSARAFADNFSNEEVLNAIDIAHFYGKKVYLTLNTLLKDSEIDEVFDFVRPFYEKGLDGVIVQDYGVATVLRNSFPAMELHASTQMTITGPEGAKFVKEKGFCRVVPARELSLQEIKAIKKESGLEIECFVHGAMCYCYSGMCLFSSVLGGRSGNRGRCAQPCRLPYKAHLNSTTEKENYPISMKDMCTLELLPDLIEAGIDSFKIEGRMKSPAYAAGVTALYRKYIDLYEKVGKEGYKVDQKDLDMLLHLYIRSDIQDGYYNKHNGADMITKGKPSYLGTDDALLEQISNQYVKMPPKHRVCMDITLKAGEAIVLHIYDQNRTIDVCMRGPVPEIAMNRPVEKEQIIKQLGKTGNSMLKCDKIAVSMDEPLFVSLKELNELRRVAVSNYEDKVRALNGFGIREVNYNEASAYKDNQAVAESEKEALGVKPCMEASVMSLEQLKSVLQFSFSRICLDADLWMEKKPEIDQIVTKMNPVGTLVLALPYVARMDDRQYYSELYAAVDKSTYIKGVLLRNLEQYLPAIQYKTDRGKKDFSILADNGLYQMNHCAGHFFEDSIEQFTIPYELNRKEMKRLLDSFFERGVCASVVIYGTIPMMVSANCIKRTMHGCDKQSVLSENQYLEDRFGKRFCVNNNCRHCYNVIYNSVPISLHNKLNQLNKMKASAYRLDFVYENEKDTFRIARYFHDLLEDKEEIPPFENDGFTTGHYGRGVE